MQGIFAFNWSSGCSKHNAIECKTDDNLIYMNMCVGGVWSGDGAFHSSDLMIRTGKGNLLMRNWIEGGDLSAKDGSSAKPNVFVRNKVTGGFFKDNYGYTVAASEADHTTYPYPRSEYARCIYLDGNWNIGLADSASAIPPATGPFHTSMEARIAGTTTTTHAGIGQTVSGTTTFPEAGDRLASLWPASWKDPGSPVRIPLSAMGPTGDGKGSDGSQLF